MIFVFLSFYECTNTTTTLHNVYSLLRVPNAFGIVHSRLLSLSLYLSRINVFFRMRASTETLQRAVSTGLSGWSWIPAGNVSFEARTLKKMFLKLRG